MITIKGEYGIETSVNSFDELLTFIDYDFISEINCSNNNLRSLEIIVRMVGYNDAKCFKPPFGPYILILNQFQLNN